VRMRKTALDVFNYATALDSPDGDTTVDQEFGLYPIAAISEKDNSYSIVDTDLYTILDIDNLDTIERNLATYFVSLPNTFYLTNDEVTPYNILSVNRIYNLDWLYDKLKED